MTKRLAFSLFGCLMLCAACRNDGTRDIRDYYYPLKRLQDGLVYEYRTHDSLTPVYWHFRSFLNREARYLTGTYYEQELEPLQMVREEVVSNGMLLQDLRLFPAGASGMGGQTSVQIEHGNIFPFTITDSLGVFLYKVHWTDAEGQTITITRNRRFAGDTVFNFMGKSHPAIVFSLLESVELDHPQAGFFEQTLHGREAYAKGLGLVFFEKGPDGAPAVRYVLHDRYPMERLENKARK